MAKVFRLFEDKDLQHWEDRGEPFGHTVIEKIPNPDGDFATKEPTSIPSPFARIDLVKTAFAYVNGYKDLDGDTIYHKIVSDCLDVGEMFFKIDLLGSRAQIKSWNKKADLELLTSSTNPRHRLYGETLELFMNQDSATYNFDLMDRMFFIFYDHQIIGGTSPATLFFTSANDLRFTDIKFGNNSLFDKDFVPLYKREPDYQRYLHHLFKAYPLLFGKMKEFAAYLKINEQILLRTNKELYNEIKGLEASKAAILEEALQSKYVSLDTGEDGDLVEAIGCQLWKKKMSNRGEVIQTNSDFTIQTTKYAGGYKPLVLQNNFSKRLVYTDKSVLWNSTTVVPYYDEEDDLNKRTLPQQLDKYPYLTVSDFLQPYIIRLVYPINAERFFDGNIRFETGDKHKHFVLPLTKRFFDFFDTADLISQMSDGKPLFEMVVYAGSVDVYIRIPIKDGGQYITFKRTYEGKSKNSGSAEPDILNNKGYIIEGQFGLTIYPFVKTENGTGSFYRAMLVDRDIEQDNKHFKYDLSFHKNSGNEVVGHKAKKTRSLKEVAYATSNFFVIEREFDFVEVKHNLVSGYIIPRFVTNNHGTEEFTFAIDFGTTNTHIEYTLDYTSKLPKSRNIFPFEITADDIQIATLHDPNAQEMTEAKTGAVPIFDLIPQEFLPDTIGKDSEFRFPQRTVIANHESLDTGNPTYSLADFNIPFVYEKVSVYRGIKVKTNLKWSNYAMNDEDERKIQAFFEELILLIRNKVLLNNGKLEETRLIWFYPSSMVEDRRNKLETIWQELFKKYITSKRPPKKISESIAPFYYFKNRGGIDASDLPVAAIDIGGGTTDIAIYENNAPKILTSFRFAANSIFGDAYNGSPERNGFVIRYYDKIRKLLEENRMGELGKVLQMISREQNSEDICAFFFSLENHKDVVEHEIPVSFQRMLSKDPDLKIVFVVFYASLIYHLARLMKSNKLEIPRFITFSGTGSKVLSLADSHHKLAGLQKFTNIIFRKVYSVADCNIEIVQHKDPKEITCKGGLHSDVEVEIDDIKSVELGTKDDFESPEKRITYNNIDDPLLLKSVVNEVLAFTELLFDINNEFNFSDKFGVDSGKMEQNKKIMQQDLMQFLKSGIGLKKEELKGKTNIPVEETLFFYPLIGALNKLALSTIIND